jgi:predicted O-methyltransferase YrrM
MSLYLFRLYSFLRHAIRSARHRKGYGIHSPFIFDFITSIINPEDKAYYYSFDIIERLREQLLNDRGLINLFNNKSTRINRISRQSLTPAKDGQVLFRIARHMKCTKMIELGTSLGIGTSYLASSSKNAKITSIDHNINVQNIARKNIEKLNISNVNLICADFDNVLKQNLENLSEIDLIFFDGNHKGEATINYFNQSKGYTHADSVFVFHDIHWSTDMYRAWKEITNDPHVSSSIECYNLGIIFFNPDFHKRHYYA